MLCLKCQFSGDTRAHDQLCGDQSETNKLSLATL